MNELAKVHRSGGRQIVTLPLGFEIGGSEVQVHFEGRRLVLEPLEDGSEPRLLAPGSYTADTLPPLSEGARKILASVDAAVARDAKSRGGGAGLLAESLARGGGLDIEDAAVAIAPDDAPLVGIDPDA